MLFKTEPPYRCGKGREPRMCTPESYPRQSEIGIKLHRSLEGRESPNLIRFRVPVTEETALQVILVGLHVFRSAFFRRLYLSLNFLFALRAAGQLTPQLCDDGLSQFALDCEHVL